MRAINVLLAILVSAAIGLLVFEGGLRIIGMGPPDTLNRFDAATGWSKKPNYSLERRGNEFHATFETNELGLRDDPMSSPAKPAGTFRVVMLGDSFTLGYTVDRKDLFVDLLEARWKAEGRNVEVLNVGTEGWSTDQEAAWMVEYGAEYDPDLVVLLPYDNDVYYCGQDDYTGLAKPKFDASGKLVSGELADLTGGWQRSTALGRLVAPKPTSERFTTSGGTPLPGDFAILLHDPPAMLGDAPERAKGALVALKNACDAVGAELVVAPIPSNSSADDDFARKFGSELGMSPSEWSADRAVEFFLQSSTAAGIRTADARSAMRTAHAKEACYLDFFGPDREWHFNPAGNRAFAGFLAGALDDLLPAKTSEAPADIVVADTEGPGGLPFWMKLYGVLWVALTALYFSTYKDEPFFLPPLKVGLILAAVFSIFMGVDWAVSALAVSNPAAAKGVLVLLILVVLGFVAYKLGSRLATVAELLKAFTLRGHWYLMPMVVVLLTIGSLLVVAASSPLVAPFIYTLF